MGAKLTDSVWLVRGWQHPFGRSAAHNSCKLSSVEQISPKFHGRPAALPPIAGVMRRESLRGE